jgi:hypothetical protein
MIGAAIGGAIGTILVPEVKSFVKKRLKKKVIETGTKVSEEYLEHFYIEGLKYLHKIANEQLPRLIHTAEKRHNRSNHSCQVCPRNVDHSSAFN